MSRIELQSYERAVNDDFILTVLHHPPRLLKLLGFTPRQKFYIGDYTVWREWPSFKRCPLEMEMVFCDMAERIRFDEALKEANAK